MRLPGDPLPKTEARPPIDFDDRSDKLFYVMGRVPDMMDSDDVAKALRAALTPAALAGAVAVLAIWAASHFFAVGFAVDVVLLAVGFALIGWGIFRALDAILDALKVVEEATSYGELDRAADLMGDAIIQLGVDSFLAIVTRGAARLTKTGGAAADALKAARPKPKPAAKPKSLTEKNPDENISVKAGASDPLNSGTAGSIRDVNPTKGKQNCVNCSIATDATLAGRPASALSGQPTSVRVLETHFNSKFSGNMKPSDITGAMSNAGSGARGIVFGARGNGVGHVFNVVNQNGTIRYLDGQIGGSASLDGFTSLHLLRTN